MHDNRRSVSDQEVVLEIEEESDVARAVVAAQRYLQDLGFDRSRGFLVATAVSELARNIFVHAGAGRITLGRLDEDDRLGFEVVAEDEGPGIADYELAFTDGYSTGQSLGLGLPGVRRIMDEVEFDASRESGTRIAARTWR